MRKIAKVTLYISDLILKTVMFKLETKCLKFETPFTCKLGMTLLKLLFLNFIERNIRFYYFHVSVKQYLKTKLTNFHSNQILINASNI